MTSGEHSSKSLVHQIQLRPSSRKPSVIFAEIQEILRTGRCKGFLLLTEEESTIPGYGVGDFERSLASRFIVGHIAPRILCDRNFKPIQEETNQRSEDGLKRKIKVRLRREGNAPWIFEVKIKEISGRLKRSTELRRINAPEDPDAIAAQLVKNNWVERPQRIRDRETYILDIWGILAKVDFNHYRTATPSGQYNEADIETPRTYIPIVAMYMGVTPGSLTSMSFSERIKMNT